MEERYQQATPESSPHIVGRYMKRSKRVLPLATRLPKIMKTAAQKQGFYEGELLLNWRKLCPEYANCTRPLKLRGGKLTVAVNSDSAKIHLQYWTPTLLQRLQTFLGTESIQNVHYITQAFQVNDTAQKTVSTPPERQDARCNTVKDDALKAALLRLSKWMMKD